MKSPEDARAAAEKWLGSHLPAAVAGVGSWETSGQTIALLGTVTNTTLGQKRDTYEAWASRWFGRNLPRGVTLREEPRKMGKSPNLLPTHLDFADLAALCDFAGGTWPTKRACLLARWAALQQRFPESATVDVLRRVKDWEDVDFDLLLNAAHWFRGTPGVEWEGRLTPRQVPVPGLHTKWLNRAGRRTLVATLAGLPNIALADRPSCIDITYADPDHRRRNGRWHDSCAIGTPMEPAYRPQVVLVCENKDTYFMFPPEVTGLIVVWGEGDAAKKADRIPAVDWIARAPRVVYWGDMDAEGFQILSRFRTLISDRGGPMVESILMDPETFKTFNEFGTKVDRKGKPLKRRDWDPIVAENLADSEGETYRLITDPAWPHHRRVEQEPMPLDLALGALRSLLSGPR